MQSSSIVLLKLMFRWPPQAINLYAERPYLQAGLPEAKDFAQATEHSKQLTNAFRSDIQKYWDELENARRKLQVCSRPLHLHWPPICPKKCMDLGLKPLNASVKELACVDMAGEITERALELVRQHIEAAAARDREEAAARLLLELELEDAGKKVGRCMHICPTFTAFMQRVVGYRMLWSSAFQIS